jgi:DNA-directed RNA polymerase II subunit RPB1
LTYVDVIIDLDDLQTRAKKYGIDFFSGKILFSSVLPRDFNYSKSGVTILDGILVNGRITSETIGTTHNSIIQVMYKNYGADITNEFSSNIKFITDQFLARRGFTVGYNDCIIPENKQQEQEKIILDAYIEGQSAAYKISKKLDNPLEEMRREAQLSRYIDSIKSVGGKITEIVGPDNSLVTMYKSGAKGSGVNVAQITTILGQQFLKGKRFPCNLSENSRCLPTFEPNSIDIRARGFALNSFMTGLTPSELFFHQAAGRTGLIDTALKTADVGDMQRRLKKILEDISVVNDGSVRNNFGNILQFIYGEDGFDAANLQFTQSPSGNVPSFIDIDADVSDINTKYGFIR